MGLVCTSESYTLIDLLPLSKWFNATDLQFNDPVSALYFMLIVVSWVLIGQKSQHFGF